MEREGAIEDRGASEDEVMGEILRELAVWLCHEFRNGKNRGTPPIFLKECARVVESMG